MKEGKVASFIKEYYPEYYIWCEYRTNECIPFSKVKDEWGILGNFYPTPLVVDGVEFCNSEQLFQMMKFTDKDTLLSIYTKRGLPMKWIAKSGEKNGLCRGDWGKIIVNCMKFCLQTKFDQSEDFRNSLDATKGKVIVEDQSTTHKKTADTWGCKKEGDMFIGSNLLGRLLMELRDDGKLDYHLPEDIFDFIKVINNS
ncbi:MAG: NADAR family protein [Muribaculaceae bacterium]|nr:NADAR family protein [Muribaculaceae bacterium]